MNPALKLESDEENKIHMHDNKKVFNNIKKLRDQEKAIKIIKKLENLYENISKLEMVINDSRNFIEQNLKIELMCQEVNSKNALN